MSTIADKIKNLPQAPGVYFFRDAKNEILYIGKATNLRSRVSSYFRNVILKEAKDPMVNMVGDIDHGILHYVQNDRKNIFSVVGRSEWISLMIAQVENIEFEQTDSVLEALILESNLIKKFLPKYNTLEKDDKSFSYFVITKEEFPRVLIVRKTDLDKIDVSPQKRGQGSDLRKILGSVEVGPRLKFGDVVVNKSYGPYTSKLQMQIALKIIRRIFPFHALRQQSEKGCLDFQLGKCPGPYAGAISKEDYKKNIRGIKMILEGRKKSLVRTLEKEMQGFAKKDEFEKAAVARNRIYALEHIRDVALMTRDFENSDMGQVTSDKDDHVSGLVSHVFRIEAYDISNISGDHAVGSMVVFENGQPNKSQYRKFKIKTVVGANDVGMMKEVLLRRFKNDWAMPDLVLLDGGLGHLNMAEKLLYEEFGLSVNIAAVAKGPTRKKLDIRISNIRDTKYEIRNTLSKELVNENNKINNILQDDNLVKSIMDEAHRFAITYHRKVRGKSFHSTT